MAGLKLEDPTVDVGDVEKYRLAFLMQFFVQHKRRFRFPRLRLQDLYQRVVKDTDATAFCDLVARILRFLNHGDPDVSIDTVDQALDRFTVDKRTSYRINVQRYRNGKPVHQLGAMARAALLDNLIESVYDEQPDFNFTSGFNSSNPVSGLSNGIRSTSGSTVLDSGDPEGTSSLFNGSDLVTSDAGDFTEPEDVNVLIKAGQDAQGCSYYYMDDLRLYRERPQSGISSHWDVAVGPTGAQWQAFILSLSRNEKEYDLYCFLKQDLFELVKHSLDSYELHSTNSELDSNFLRAKEASELAELRRRKGLVSSRLGGDGMDGAKLTFTTASNLATNGPKSASPAFSGGHGACGIGNSSSTSSGAPLTPSSARTPTSAPPATASGYCLPSLGPADLSDLLPTSKTDHMQTSQYTNRSQSMCDVPPKMNTVDVSDSPASHKGPELCVTQPSGLHTETTSCPAVKSESSEQLAGTPRHTDTSTWSCTAEADVTTSGISNTFNDPPSTNDTSWSSPNHCSGKPLAGPRQPSQAGSDARISTSAKKVPMAASNDMCNLPASPGPASVSANPTQTQSCLSVSTTSQPIPTKQQVYTVDQSPNKDGQLIPECNNGRTISGPLRPVPGDPVDSMGLGDRQVPPGSKPPIGPATALVPPMVGMPDGGPALTQEQWENRKSKIAQLEKIHSTLSKSKSASTPGAVAAAAGVVLQQQQRLPHNGSAMPTEFAQLPPSITHQSTGLSSPVGFGPSPYPPVPRQVLAEGFPVSRLSGLPGGPPPNELAQREWDRICLDYQREKGEPPGPRFHPAARPPPSATAYDTGGCPLVQSDVGISPPGPVMIPSGHMSMEHPSCHAPQRHYPSNPDGPPVVMVPPNNSNLTGANAPYPLPGSGPVPSASVQHFRSAHSMGHGCPDQSHACMLPTGQKRPYYGSYGDSWVPSNSGCMMGPLSSNDSSMYPGNLPPTGSVQPQRGSSLCQGSFGSTPPTSLPMVTAANVVTNSSSGRTSGVSKAGGKKRKAAAVTGRVSAVNTPTTPTTNYQSQPQYAYGKQSGPNNSAGPITPNKPPYSSMYMSDPSQAGFHRSVYASSPGQQNFGPPTAYPGSDPYFLHYPEPNMGRPIGNSGLAIESRRALTPKGADSFAMGPAGYPIPYSATSGGRIPSNCGMPFSSPGSGSIAHPYMHSPDMPGSHCEMTPGLRPSQTGSCTQHLTSASLASLARLSQLSGSESPYVPSSASGGNSLGAIPGTANYGGRAGVYHPDNVVVMSGSHPPVPPQAVRGLPGSVPMGLKPHDSELPPGAPSMHTKFTTQGYHGPPQQQHSGPAQPSLPQQQQQQQQVQSQQPPSIQVNNTFFNAQLNVQQMNYQHVSAPGSTGQMQIHFVQQQQQHDQPGGTSSGGGGNARSTRQTNPSSRMSVPPGSDYYPSQTPMGHATNYGPESGAVQRVSQFPNSASNAEFQVTKSDGPISTCNSLPPSGVGPAATSYGNTSVQITPRTPHTIQYLPTVNPSQTELQQPGSQYPSAESAQNIRSKGLRSNVQYGSSDPTMFGHIDMPMPETMKQASFSSGTVYATQSVTQAASHQHFQQQQQQYGSQAIFPSQPSNQGKNAPSHPLSARGSWVSSAEGHFDSNSTAGPPSVFHPGTVDAQLMSSGPVGRPSVHTSHPSSRINIASYPSSYSGDPMDQTMTDSVPGSEVVGPGFQHRTSHPQYSRQSAANKHESPAAVQLPPVQQQHTYRHQQQQHYSQNAQQHQMFMSSSMGSLTPDGSGASNQVQFMMSASSTSSSLNASSTMQSTSTTLVTGDVSPMPTTVNATSEATTVPSGGMCGGMASEMKLSQYDPVSSVKRAMLLPPTNDDIKPPGSLNGPSSFNASSAQLSNRVSWQSNPNAIAAIPNNHSTLDQQHLVGGGSYATSYSSTAYATTASSNSGTGQSTGFVDALGGGIRDVIGHPQAATTCDLPPAGLSQPPYSSSIVQ